MDFKINQELLEKILQYLANKPYVEVFNFINKLQNLEIIKSEEKK